MLQIQYMNGTQKINLKSQNLLLKTILLLKQVVGTVLNEEENLDKRISRPMHIWDPLIICWNLTQTVDSEFCF